MDRGQNGSWTVRVVAAVVVAGLMAVGCSGDDDGAGPVPDSSNADTAPAEASTGPVDTSNFDDIVRVTPHVDEGQVSSGWIGLDGGTLTLDAADGTTFTLDVPADSLRFPAEITMTAVAAIDGLPFGDGPAYAVDLQPSGLIFDVPATLTITPAEPIDVDEQLPFTYQGSELTIARPSMETPDVAIEVDHFSGYGVAKGFLGDVEEVRHRLGEDALRRIESEINAFLVAERQRELAGEEPNPEWGDRMREYFEQIEREVVEPRMAAAGESCAAGRLAAETHLGFARQWQITLGEEYPTSYHEVIDTVASVCMQEEHEICVDHHVIHRLPPIHYSFERSSALIGAPTEEVLAESRRLLEDCLRFELEVEVTAAGETDWGYLAVRSEDTARFTTDVVFDAEAIRFTPTTATMESDQPAYDVTAGGCTAGSPEPWSASAQFLEVRWGVTDYDDTKELGELEWLVVFLDMPDATLAIPSLVCNGADGGPFEDPVTSAAIFELAVPDQAIRDWNILGEETVASAEWDVEAPTGTTGQMRSFGWAELRHTPGGA
ncbi:hypothetical protein [Actinomarinicola tropica]|uniref:Uncharacterized protein n=1 Tax=Actinomarinicola tropica TaxID=2789776 RepID=A0A5Q2RIA8_9ACTN|nr:hypothetical protein [Actinomarinicola tropica]QGG96598.1 hypothetical protein GH723_16640 [Actinomarinicola tropica]